jgi:trans-2,3-dihydro-3-hydroxyanthranilate isomerase
MPRRFVTLDVFTRRRHAGNPLAVVLDAEGLGDEAMQATAREFNLSETVFVLPPDDPRRRAKLRIFTPGRELPFAGHPTVGAAVLLALLDREGEAGALAFGLEERVGVVPCAVEIEGPDHGRSRFRLPRLPEIAGEGRDVAEAAWALGLEPPDVGFGRHVPSRHSAGVPYDLVPVETWRRSAAPAAGRGVRAGVRRRSPVCLCLHAADLRRGASLPCPHVRPGMGIAEDPATGSAAAAFAGALMQFEPLGDGEHSFVIEQGYEMGRPSQIELQIVIREGALVSAEIGGDAVVMSEGTLRG